MHKRHWLFCLAAFFASMDALGECSDTGAFVRIFGPVSSDPLFRLMDKAELSVIVNERSSPVKRVELFNSLTPIEAYDVDGPQFSSGNDGEYVFSIEIGPEKSGAEVILPPGQQNLVVKAITEDGCDNFDTLEVFGGNSRIRALVVGISDYEVVSDLEFADNDAKDFETLLREMFPNKNGQKQIDVFRLDDEDAELKFIEIQLDKAKSDLTKWATFIFFFSGHGMIFKDHDTPLGAYLVTYDGLPDHPDITMLDKTVLIEEHFAGIKAQEKFFILDSCFGGAVTSSVIVDADEGAPKVLINVGDSILREAQENANSLFKLPQGIVGLVSSSGTTVSYEKEELGNGVFTEYLIRGVRETDLEQPPDVRFSDLITYIKNRIQEEQNGIQEPQLLVLPLGDQHKTFVRREDDAVTPP